MCINYILANIYIPASIHFRASIHSCSGYHSYSTLSAPLSNESRSCRVLACRGFSSTYLQRE
jgi:hypothetical protein